MVTEEGLREVGRVELGRLLKECFVPDCGEFEQFKEGKKGGLLAKVGDFGIGDFDCVGYFNDQGEKQLVFYELNEENSLEGLSIVDWNLLENSDLETPHWISHKQVAIPSQPAKSVCVYREEGNRVEISFMKGNYSDEGVNYNDSLTNGRVRGLCLGVLIL